MTKVSVYCCTIENCKVLEKLPSYITPVGLGNKKFPKNNQISINTKQKPALKNQKKSKYELNI